MYVADSFVNTVSVFRTSDLAKVASLQPSPGSSPLAQTYTVAASADGNFVYSTGPMGVISRYSTDAWTELDATSNTVLEIGPDKWHKVDSADFFQIQLSLDGKTLYATNFADNSLVTIDVDPEVEEEWHDTRVPNTSPGFSHLLALSPDGKKAYAAWKGGSGVEIHDLDTGSVTAAYGATEASNNVTLAGDMVVSPNGDVFLISNFGLLTKVHNGSVSAKVTTKGAPAYLHRSVSVTPNGKYVVVAGGAFVEVYDTDSMFDGAVPVATFENDASAFFLGLAIDGDGERAYASALDGSTTVLDLRDIPESAEAPYQLPAQWIEGNGPGYTRGYAHGSSVFFTSQGGLLGAGGTVRKVAPFVPEPDANVNA
ncbi:YncE family protein, partial [Leucobacter musarum]|uniref:YncE family protein n=1 Tax=Leucobacter musarum TaxID=1930747 RepID=UPI0012E1AF36